jgi:hypothetical protein
MTGEGDIPFIQCKMSPMRLRSVGEVDGLSLIVIAFYVPALKSHLNSTESSKVKVTVML